MPHRTITPGGRRGTALACLCQVTVYGRRHPGDGNPAVTGSGGSAAGEERRVERVGERGGRGGRAAACLHVELHLELRPWRLLQDPYRRQRPVRSGVANGDGGGAGLQLAQAGAGTTTRVLPEVVTGRDDGEASGAHVRCRP